MLLTIPSLFSKEQVAEARAHLLAAEWVDGRVTAGYQAPPLDGVWATAPYFHNGSFPTLLAVVNHYDSCFNLGLSDQQKSDLVQFLKGN